MSDLIPYAGSVDLRFRRQPFEARLRVVSNEALMALVKHHQRGGLTMREISNATGFEVERIKAAIMDWLYH